MKNPIESCIDCCQMTAKPLAIFGFVCLLVVGLSSNVALAQNPPMQVSGLCTTDLSLEFVTEAEEDVANGLLGWTDGNSGNTYTNVHGLGIDLRIEAFAADGVSPQGMDYRGAVRALFSLDNPNGIQWIIVISAFETETNIPAELNDFAFTAEDFEFRPEVGFEGLERISRLTTRDATGINRQINIQNEATVTTFAGDPVYSNGGFSLDGSYEFTNVASPDKWVRVALPSGNYHQIEVVGEQIDDGGQPAFSLCNPNGADRGDAPSSYMDAAHFIDDSNVHFLGTTAPDLEFEELWEWYPSDASGDNVNGIDDEDGVSFSTAVVGEVLTVTATVNGANGLLQGWIDWNQNGTFDPAEQIATNVADNSAADTNATIGFIVLAVPVPMTATLGDTFARFRWSTDTDLDATESTDNGEVEDYLLGVVTPADIVVSKTLTGETGSIANVAEPGETLTYTISFQNTGGSAITYMAGEIVETVPNNTTATGGDFTCTPDNSAGSSCTTDVLTIAAGATETLTFIVQVDDPIPAGVTSIDNAIVVRDECPVAGNPQGAGNDCDESTPTPSPTALPIPQVVPVLSPLGYLSLALGLVLLGGLVFRQQRIDKLQS